VSESYKLLYAEDEVTTRKNHVEYLRSRYNFSIIQANDGLEALKLYEEHQPDIVLTDITMPNMDGLTFVKKLREISQHTKVIVITAHSGQEQLLQALDLSVINYLIKPLNRTKLCSAIDVALETLPAKEENLFFYLSKQSYYDKSRSKLITENEEVKLSKSEQLLLALLCENTHAQVDAYDIFVHIWSDSDKEFSAESVRTLVKKLRRKLPEGVLENVYGGFYKIKSL